MSQTTIPASHAPARLSIRRKPTNLVKIFEKPEVATKQRSRSSSFHKEAVISQIKNFCSTACERIESECIVSVTVDEVGAHLNVIHDKFIFSFIYQEGGKS